MTDSRFPVSRQNVVDLPEDAFHLRIGADRDADAVTCLRPLEVSDEDVAFAKGREKVLRFVTSGQETVPPTLRTSPCRRACEDEVRLGLEDIPAALLQFGDEPHARRDHLPDRGPEGLLVLERREGKRLGDCIDVIAVLDLEERVDEILRTHAVSDAEPRERIGL